MKLSEVSVVPISEFERNVLECLKHIRGEARYATGNALGHLTKAWHLADIDAEMAVFRGITAEEEVASALFIILKQKKYNGADRLKHTSHLHKLGLRPFLRIIETFLAGVQPLPEMSLSVEERGKAHRLILKFRVMDHWVEPLPPLGFNINEGDMPYLFQREINSTLTKRGARDLQEHLKGVAAFRRKLLYATSGGLPAYRSDVKKYLANQQVWIFTVLRLICLIFPYRDRALFVQQVLDAFLHALKGADVKESAFG